MPAFGLVGAGSLMPELIRYNKETAGRGCWPWV